MSIYNPFSHQTQDDLTHKQGQQKLIKKAPRKALFTIQV
jgi:hypothetical protein